MTSRLEINCLAVKSERHGSDSHVSMLNPINREYNNVDSHQSRKLIRQCSILAPRSSDFITQSSNLISQSYGLILPSSDLNRESSGFTQLSSGPFSQYAGPILHSYLKVKEPCLTEHEIKTSRERVDDDFSITGDNGNSRRVSKESSQVNRKENQTKDKSIVSPDDETKIFSMDDCRHLLRQTQNLPQDMNSQLRITGVSFSRDRTVIEFLEANGHQQLTNEELLKKFSAVLRLESSRIKLVKLSEYGSCTRTAMPGCIVYLHTPAKFAVQTSSILSAYIVAREIGNSNGELYALSCGHDKEEGAHVYVNINTIRQVKANVQYNNDSGNNSEQSSDTESLYESGSPYNRADDPNVHRFEDKRYLGQVEHVIFSDWNEYSVDCCLIKVKSNLIGLLSGVKIGNREVFISSCLEVIPGSNVQTSFPVVQTYTTNTKRGVVFSCNAHDFGSSKHDRPIRDALLIRTEDSTDACPQAIHGNGESGLLVVTTIETGTPGEGDAVYVEAVAMIVATKSYGSQSYSIALPVSIALRELEEHKFQNRLTLTIWKPEENLNSEENPRIEVSTDDVHHGKLPELNVFKEESENVSQLVASKYSVISPRPFDMINLSSIIVEEEALVLNAESFYDAEDEGGSVSGSELSDSQELHLIADASETEEHLKLTEEINDTPSPYAENVTYGENVSCASFSEVVYVECKTQEDFDASLNNLSRAQRLSIETVTVNPSTIRSEAAYEVSDAQDDLSTLHNIDDIEENSAVDNYNRVHFELYHQSELCSNRCISRDSSQESRLYQLGRYFSTQYRPIATGREFLPLPVEDVDILTFTDSSSLTTDSDCLSTTSESGDSVNSKNESQFSSSEVPSESEVQELAINKVHDDPNETSEMKAKRPSKRRLTMGAYMDLQSKVLNFSRNNGDSISSISLIRGRMVIEYLASEASDQLSKIESFLKLLGLKNDQIKLIKLGERGVLKRTVGSYVKHTSTTQTAIGGFVSVTYDNTGVASKYALVCGHDKREGCEVLNGDDYLSRLGQVEYALYRDDNNKSMDVALVKLDADNIPYITCKYKILHRGVKDVRVYLRGALGIAKIGQLVQVFTSGEVPVYGRIVQTTRTEPGENYESPLYNAIMITTDTDGQREAIHGEGESGKLITTPVDEYDIGFEPSQDSYITSVKAIGMLVAKVDRTKARKRIKSYSLALPINESLADLKGYIRSKKKTDSSITFDLTENTKIPVGISLRYYKGPPDPGLFDLRGE